MIAGELNYICHFILSFIGTSSSRDTPVVCLSPYVVKLSVLGFREWRDGIQHNFVQVNSIF